MVQKYNLEITTNTIINS